MKNIARFKNDIYAGVLGKIIGVYLGRPVEGWTYEAIRDTFGEINYYKNHRTGAPLIVPDDDISGTFAFFRSLEDNKFDPDIRAEQIGDSWLNYIIENETILWSVSYTHLSWKIHTVIENVGGDILKEQYSNRTEHG